PRGRLPPIGAEHAVALRDRHGDGDCLALLFSARRKDATAMTTGHEQASLFLEGWGRNRRQLISPEGVSLPVEIADYGERATAFVLDLFIWFAATALLYLIILFVAFI